MPKIAVIFGTRPEAIKLAPVILGLTQAPEFEVDVVLTGQHREMVDQVLQLFHIQPDVDLNIMQATQSLTDIALRTLTGLEPYLKQAHPDMVLVQGDTASAFLAALAAFYQQIPIGHVEAGLRTDDLFNPYPEEANRRLISQIASLHFAPTPLTLTNLKQSQVTGQLYMTGNTVIDALLQVASQDRPCAIAGLEWFHYRVLLATVHRRENWGDPLVSIAQAFLAILEHCPDTALLLPLHPNPRVREPLQAYLGSHPRIFLTEPLDYVTLVEAMKRCTLILSDSGGIQEEAPSLGKPVLILRTTTERQEAVEAGTARLVGTETEGIVQAALSLLQDPDQYQQMALATNPFGDGQATQRIVAALKQWFNCNT